VLAGGLAHAFRSDQTPDIGANGGRKCSATPNGQQQAGMLNQIIAALGPTVASGLAGGVLVASWAAERAGDCSAGVAAVTQQVQDVVQSAHQANPGIAEELASFYSTALGLIKTLGGAALALP